VPFGSVGLLGQMINMDRRSFIQTSVLNLGALALGARPFFARPALQGQAPQQPAQGPVLNPSQPGGSAREITLVAEAVAFEIPTRGVFQKWLYNGQYPGPEIRVREGERLRLTVRNNLLEGTTIHWHGIPLPNAMDGVPDVTQPAIPPGGTFQYEFDAAPSGSFLYHSHFGLQPDRGLVGRLIIEEKNSHVAYDREYSLVLTDFLAGPPALLGRVQNASGGMVAMQVPPYLVLLINGRPSEAPTVFEVKSGEKVRLRLINPSGTTIYRFAIGGHPLVISHADGRPIEPYHVDSLFIGPGERYDVIVEAKNPGAWPIAASPDNDLPPARAVLRYTDSNDLRPKEGALPEGLSTGRMLHIGDVRGLDVPESRKPDRTFNFTLAGGSIGPISTMSEAGVTSKEIMGPQWTINGQAYPNASPMEIHHGESIRIRLTNQSAMPHPMHLHGHFFRVGNTLKDTTIVWTGARAVELDFVANNPGSWLFHCHNLYHMESGMVRLLKYV